MSSYCYVAIDPRGKETRGTLNVPDQLQALQRIKEMGLYPTRLFEQRQKARQSGSAIKRAVAAQKKFEQWTLRLHGGVKSAALTVFTRQIATLVESGMPLLRGLRILEQQEENRVLKNAIAKMADSIESGSSLTEAVAQHPKIFNGLYQNMVRAGEISGALETTLKRLAEFMEKAQRIKGKVKAAMFYPGAVMVVAGAILALLMIYVVPKFKMVFEGLTGSAQLPAFSVFVFRLSEDIKNHALWFFAGLSAVALLFTAALQTKLGRYAFDALKLAAPIVGPLFRKVAISRFARTLGTLVASGVPILQALTIVKDTAGNVIVGRVISRVHDNVKQGDPIAPTLKASSRIFPLMVAGMVDIGEQTGALPEMLMKVADNYDEEVDNATTSLTSLLEPIMIVILAVIVGSIVIAMFLPLVGILNHGIQTQPGADDI